MLLESCICMVVLLPGRKVTFCFENVEMSAALAILIENICRLLLVPG